MNAELLLHVDLTINEEKSTIKYYFKEAIKTLKEEDRLLPQVRKFLDVLI